MLLHAGTVLSRFVFQYIGLKYMASRPQRVGDVQECLKTRQEDLGDIHWSDMSFSDTRNWIPRIANCIAFQFTIVALIQFVDLNEQTTLRSSEVPRLFKGCHLFL